MIHQKGFAPILIILLIAAAIGGYFIYTNYSNNRTKPVQQATQPSPTSSDVSPTPNGVGETANRGIPKPLSMSTSYKVISSNEISPDQKYVIGQVQTGDYVTIEVALHNAGTANYITTDLVKENENVIGYGTKFRCPCSISFKGWSANDRFIIIIFNELGEEYEYLVSISDSLNQAEIIEDSLRRIK